METWSPPLEQTGICLWDTWGVDNDNYRSGFMQRILQGEVPDGYEMEDVSVDGRLRILDDEEETAEDRNIHAILLFVPIGILEDDSLIPNVLDILKSSNRMGILFFL